MTHMVSARIPDAVFKQANILLRDMGSNPSELVNAAFEYLITEKHLPNSKQPDTKKRVLSKQELSELCNLFKKCTPQNKINISTDIATDKHIAVEARIAKYEALD